MPVTGHVIQHAELPVGSLVDWLWGRSVRWACAAAAGHTLFAANQVTFAPKETYALVQKQQTNSTGFYRTPAHANSPSVTVRIDVNRTNSWIVGRQLFGSFFEEHWGDVTTGVYEQYLVNPSFEPWYEKPGENKTRIVFPVPAAVGVAYPWEPYSVSGSSVCSLATNRVNSEQSQCIEVRGLGGVVQRLALPDYRVTRYRLRCWARTEGILSVQAVLLDGSQGTNNLDQQTIPATGTWAPYEVELDLGHVLTDRHVTHFGVARLGLVASGNGCLFLDQATFFPLDCVDGVYNPETLANVKQFGPTAIRWPGGNYASGYHWRDGIGPLDRRPTRPNRAWGGSEPNHVGTDEWLRFCQRSSLEPVISVGFGEITAAEAADWVEYCNGTTNTPLGALRAANGHAVPYNVKYWGVGNEVYGSYQIGHTNATAYARGFLALATAMRGRDPSIKLIAVGLGVHNDYRAQSRTWNQTLLNLAGSAMDLLDVHYYVYGPDDAVIQSEGQTAVQRALLGSSGRAVNYYNELRALLNAKMGTRGVGLVHYEWGVLPRSSLLGASRESFLNALATTGQYHAFLRNGDLLKGAMLHNFSCYVSTVPEHSEPPNPRSYISQLYAAFAGARLVDTACEGPVYSVTNDYPEIGPLAAVPDVDALAARREDGTLRVALLNRSLSVDYDVNLHFQGLAAGAILEMIRYGSDRPSDSLTWMTPKPVLREAREKLIVNGTNAVIRLDRLSLAHLSIREGK